MRQPRRCAAWPRSASTWTTWGCTSRTRASPRSTRPTGRCSRRWRPRFAGSATACRSRGCDVDWAGWALFGLLATAALTAVLIAAQLAGVTRLDLPLLLGTLVTEDPDRARFAGFFVHLGVGEVFAFGYAATFALL